MLKKETIVIVGSGLAGSEFANQLDKQKYDVFILEAGDNTPSFDNNIKFLDRRFGPTPVRSLNIGGTSALWHGAIMPHSVEELSINDSFEMPIGLNEFELAQNYTIKKTLGKNPFCNSNNKIDKISDRLDFVQMAVPRHPTRAKIIQNSRLISDVKNIQLEFENSRIKRIFFEVNKNIFQIDVDYLIISCGGLGTPLLLNKILPLEFQDENLGRYLIDHPMGYIGKVKLEDNFKKDFQLDEHSNENFRLRRGFSVHDTEQNLYHCFYLRPTKNLNLDDDMIIKKYKLNQFRNHNEIKNFYKFLDIDIVIEALFLKYGMNLGNTYSIVCVSEQNSKIENRVYGELRNPIINWSLDEKYQKSVNDAVDQFIGFLAPYSKDINIFNHRFSRFWSAAHLSGTCRMSSSDDAAVLNNQFRYKKIDNLFVCDGSILPKIGYSNTGATILTLANILANRFNSKTQYV